MKGKIPSLRPLWLDGYDKSAFGRDVLAGAILSVLLIPQAMAYATLAGLSPGTGLLTAMVAPVIYAILGQAAAVSLGPVALASLLVADAVASDLAAPMTVAAIVAVEAGAILAILGLTGMGRLVNFVSEPVLLGFTAAAAVLIAFSQLPGLLGMEAARSGTLWGAARALLDAGLPDLPTTILGVAALMGFLFGARPMRHLALVFRLTGTARLALLKATQLVVIILATLVAAWLLPSVARVPNPDAGLPVPVIPIAAPEVWARLLLPSLVIATVVFVTGAAVAKSLSSRRRKALDTSREALAIGAANIATGLTGGYATGVSLSRSALVDDADARSPLSSAIGALIVLPVSLFGGAFLAMLPKAALAALVMSAVVGLVKVQEIREVLRHSRGEGVVVAVTFLATLGLGVQWGLLAGALAGIAHFLWASSLPRVTREGEDPEAGDGIFRSVDRAGVRSDTGPILVIRIDRPLYFGNVGHAEDRVSKIVSEHPEARVLVLDMRAVTEVDATGLRMLTRLLDGIEERNLTVAFASLQRPIRRALEGQKHIDRCAHFDTVGAAVRATREGRT